MKTLEAEEDLLGMKRSGRGQGDGSRKGRDEEFLWAQQCSEVDNASAFKPAKDRKVPEANAEADEGGREAEGVEGRVGAGGEGGAEAEAGEEEAQAGGGGGEEQDGGCVQGRADLH